MTIGRLIIVSNRDEASFLFLIWLWWLSQELSPEASLNVSSVSSVDWSHFLMTILAGTGSVSILKFSFIDTCCDGELSPASDELEEDVVRDWWKVSIIC